ncbi:hypothetical protein J4E83_007493 [Alternaria metachromatica]|uniref:uncharacterized protein n=1 Tax=Alternaria metachromatica TaxID=283354 RepID=UPI0020C4F456|nr:uncharacterized protein J4E83_007493 [Alternaria metachromatica]KAI4613082.1 hypothetical protein J4E83_007493 [Alternaria metachromatica]
MSCARGCKAEQNWQADAHGKLQRQLKSIIEKQRRDSGFRLHPTYQSKDSVAFFHFRAINSADGVAARVWTFDDPAGNVRSDERVVNQQRRDAPETHYANISSNLFGSRQGLDMDRIQELIDAGLGSQYIVPANDSDGYDSWSDADLTGTTIPMSHMNSTRWMDEEDDDDDDIFDEHYDIDEESEMERLESREESTNVQTEPRNEQVSPSYPIVARQSDTRTISGSDVTPLLTNASLSDLEKARIIVEKAIAESSKLNQARLLNPMRNNYGLKPGTFTGQSKAKRHLRVREDGTPVPPLLNITDSIANAAALVAEADAVGIPGNLTKRAVPAKGTYWMGSIARKGTVPWGDNATYAVFRNVLDYGAVGNGITDDTKAFKAAMLDGKRCGKGCNGSTLKNAIVYIPPGTYLISTTIPMPFGTQVIGDANDRPTVLASKSFIGMGVLSTDEYTGGGTGADGLDEEYYINTANFYRQIRNVIIDVRQTRASQKVSCLHYQVAQATSTQNVLLIAGPTQNGMYAENGSGGQISDITFQGGAIGLYGGSQQFTAQRLKFEGCTIGVHLIWDWGWVWKSITMNNVGTGFKLVPDSTSGAAAGNIGSASFLDSSFNNVKTVVQISPPTSTVGSGSTGLILENIKLSGVGTTVADTGGKTILAGSSSKIDEWAMGPVYKGSADKKDRKFTTGEKVGSFRRHSTLVDSDGAYFERPKPQYEDRSVGDFVHIKDLGAKGDGITDDTAAFQAALYASLGKILFVDAGSYILTSTVTVPSGSKIVGETWSQLVASGSYFEDALHPKVLLKVGTNGQVGDVEMQDLFFTTVGATAGAILVEWNLKASSAGSAALWDCHARVGGATGTNLTPKECPPVTSGVDQGCSAASLMFHLTSSGSAYLENAWFWVADRMIDDPDLESGANNMVQNSVYVARGFLAESTEPTWLYGVASEHAVFYQFNFHRAQNIFAGLLQTESPYYQPTPSPPAPFKSALGVFSGDPKYECAAGDEFSGCDESWAIIMRESQNVFIASAGLYSWFSTYAQTCIDQQLCQKALLLLEKNFSNVRIQHLVTIGAKYMAVMDGKGILAKDNLNVDSHPFWSQISVLDVSSNGSMYDEYIWVDPKIWDMEQPAFTCSPPCNVKIPPWTRATSTLNYPLITVSDGEWTSTITKPPMTISEWVFEPVTLTGQAVNQKRQGFEAFWPKPATTPHWPSVIYAGPDGDSTTVGPKISFPKPPQSIGPNAQPPPTGSWPKRQIQPIIGQIEEPLVKECGFIDWVCFTEPWIFGDNNTSSDGDNGDFDENWEDSWVVCPIPSSSSSSSTSSRTSTKTTTSEDPPEPTASPREGDPMQNEVDCYGGLDQKTEHARMDSAIHDFCIAIGSSGDVFKENYFKSLTYTFYHSTGTGVQILISLSVDPGCQFKYDYDLCHKYLEVPVNSCQCGGVNGKQGGFLNNDCYEWRIDPQTTF